MKKLRFFSDKVLKTLPIGFQFFKPVDKKRSTFNVDAFVKPNVPIGFYSSDKCMVFKFNKPISKIVRLNLYQDGED